MTDNNVIRLVDHACGIAVADNTDLFNWMRNWADQLEKDANVRSLIIVCECDDGSMFKLSQSAKDLDKVRLMGLFHMITHYAANGDCEYPKLGKI